MDLRLHLAEESPEIREARRRAGVTGPLPTEGPEAADFREHVGDVHAERGNYQRAIGEYKEAHRLDPGNSRRLVRLADAYGAADMPGKALRVYQQALREGNGDPEVFMGLGDLACQVANTRAAVKEYRRAVKRQPRRAYYRYKLAAALFVTGDYEGAVAELETAVTLAPDDAYYHFMLGELYLAGGITDRAVTYFEQAVALAPKDEYYCIRLGAAYLRTDRPREACRAFRSSVNLAPENSSYRVLLGQAHLAAGDEERARAELSQAGPLDPYEQDFVRRIRKLAALGD